MAGYNERETVNSQTYGTETNEDSLLEPYIRTGHLIRPLTIASVAQPGYIMQSILFEYYQPALSPAIIRLLCFVIGEFQGLRKVL